MVIRIGLIGCGAITTKAHIPALVRDARFTISALCRRDVDQLASLHSQFPSARAYSTAEELFESRGADCVLIATDVGSHLALVQEAVDHEVFALIEKPVAPTADDVAAFLERNSGRLDRVMVAFNKRFYPGVTKLKQLQAEGRLSNPVGGTLSFVAAQGRKTGRGGVLQNLIHTCDLLVYLFGKAVDVRSHFSSRLNDSRRGKTISSSIMTEHGCCVNLFFSSSSNWKAPTHERLELLDDRQNKYSTENADTAVFSELELDKEPDAWGNHPVTNTLFRESNSVFFRTSAFGYEAQMSAFGDLVEGKVVAPSPSLQDAFHAHDLFDRLFAEENERG